MKKILIILMSLFFANNLSASNLTSSTKEKRLWTVTITVNITVDYYESEYLSDDKYLGTENKGQIKEKFSIYAETPDEAERIAKEKCFHVCSTTNGEPQGPSMYKGKLAYGWLYRTIETARAVEAE